MKTPHTQFAVAASVVTLAAALAATTTSAQTEVSLIPTGGVWKYLDTGTNPGTAWRAPDFDDSAWPSGPAQLGYGDGDEATIVSYGPDPNNKYITTYFRRSFLAEDVGGLTHLLLRLVHDDGAVVYLNGAEAYRVFMPPGPITYDMVAAQIVLDNAVSVTSLSPTLLVPGTNVVAVEVHQVHFSGSDLSFDLELAGTQSGSDPVQPGIITFASAQYTVNEQNRDAVITVLRTNGNAGPATVEYRVAAGSADPGADFQARIGTLTFFGDQTSASFEVPIVNDAIIESSETVVLILTNAGEGLSFPGGVSSITATLTIVDNDLISGVKLNEMLAATTPGTTGPNVGWIEFHNTNAQPVDLADCSVTDTPSVPRRWTFPLGAVLAPDGFLVVRCDPNSPPSGAGSEAWNTGFGLDPAGGTLYFFDAPGNGGALLDTITFGLQAAGFSLSRVPDGSGAWMLGQPTEAATNRSVTPGWGPAPKINEWMAHPQSGGDWFELYNPASGPVSIGDWKLTDDLSNPAKYRIPSLSFIGHGAGGFAVFVADNRNLPGANHVPFRLNELGGSIGLFDPIGETADAVQFGPQPAGISEGRLPDASVNIGPLPSASPGQPNHTGMAWLSSLPVVLVPSETVWRYLDTGGAPDPGWRDLEFEEGYWQSGLSKFGFGEGDENTPLRFYPTNHSGGGEQIITYYFRHVFVVPQPARFTNLTLHLLRDDGAAVYLNGTEVRRDNLPDGTIANDTGATNVVGDPDEHRFFPSTVPASALVPGTNVLAVELHQFSAYSGDVGFDLELDGLPAILTPGAVDLSFNPVLQTAASPPALPVQAMAVQPDGRIVVGGSFTNVDGVACTNLVRLRPDGLVDPTFTSPFTTFWPEALIVQPDGRILVGGAGYPSPTENGLIRLKADGSRDPVFQFCLGAFRGAMRVSALALQPDDRIVVSALFTMASPGSCFNVVARLNPNGTCDSSFRPLTNGYWRGQALALQSDGRILVGGSSIACVAPGLGAPSGGLPPSLMRLNGDGTPDTSFQPPDLDSGVAAIALNELELHGDGRVLAGGSFSVVDGVLQRGLASFYPDGSLDTSFQPDFNGPVTALGVQPGGLVVVGGNFTLANHVAHQGLARLNPDGTLDETFRADLAFSPGPFALNAVTFQSDGQILVGGLFTSVNGTPCTHLARLEGGFPRITVQPVSQTNSFGGTATLTVEATGIPPLSYQWLFYGQAIPDATNATLSFSYLQERDVGEYAVVVSNRAGFVVSSNASLVFPPYTTLAEALDNYDLVWRTGQLYPWVGQSGFTETGDSASSPCIGAHDYPYIETRVTGPGVVTFRWSVWSWCGNGITFSIDDQPRAYLRDGTGDGTGCEQVSGTVPPGVHTLRWSYFSCDNLCDSASLDQVTYTRGAVLVAALDAAQGACRLQLSGLVGQVPVILEASTNLSNWKAAYTNTVPSDSCEFLDPFIRPARFYRAVLPSGTP